MSEELAELAAALSAAQAEIPAPKRTHKAEVRMKTGGTYSYTYSTLDDLITALRGPLAKHGLSFVQSVTSASGHSGITVAVGTTILHKSGQSIDTGNLMLPGGDTAQAAGSAITYGRRYSLSAAFGVTAEDDDDGATTQSNAPTTPAQAAAVRAAIDSDISKAVKTMAPGPPPVIPGDIPPVLVQGVTEKKGLTKGGEPYIIYNIAFSDKRTASTFDAQLAVQARAMAASRVWVLANLAPSPKNPKYWNLIGLEAAKGESAVIDTIAEPPEMGPDGDLAF